LGWQWKERNKKADNQTKTMKTKHYSKLVAAAMGAALIAATYTLSATCYATKSTDACRNHVTSTPPLNSNISGTDCTLDSNSGLDDQVALSYSGMAGHLQQGFQPSNATTCLVLYDCVDGSTQRVPFNMNSGITLPQGCTG
jgi:hypothetical protein